MTAATRTIEATAIESTLFVSFELGESCRRTEDAVIGRRPTRIEGRPRTGSGRYKRSCPLDPRPPTIEVECQRRA
jgi:hypothetical protein